MYNVYQDLKRRFISDLKLPIGITEEPHFRYFLNLYEKEWKAETKWNELIRLIDDKFNYNPQLFLEEYYKIRDNIITTIENSEAYKRFNECDMNKYSIGKMNVSSNNIYNNLNIGKRFLSIDLKKANFQALKFVDPNIVLGAETYEDFIGNFTDLDYVKESKYTRQVIFGKLNPKRHITVEKYIMKSILDYIKENLPYFNDFTLVSFANDEIVFEIGENHEDRRGLADQIKKDTGFYVSVEEFRLYGLQLKSSTTFDDLPTVYFKLFDDNTKKMKGCPLPYHAVAYKKLHGMVTNSHDYCFKYENTLCTFCEQFEADILFCPKQKHVDNLVKSNNERPIIYSDNN